MANQQLTQLMQIDLSGRGGLANKFWGDIANSSGNPERRYIAGPNQMVQGVYNPFLMYGYMAPPISTGKALTGSYDSGVLTTTTYDSTNQATYFAGGTKVFKASTLDATSVSTSETVAGATMTDLEIYQLNGVRHIFYSYQTSGAGDVGTAVLPFGSANDTWLSGTATGAFSLGQNLHRLVTADNGYMYILDGSAVHKVDGTTAGGTNGIVTSNVLFFPPYFKLNDGVDNRGYMYITVQDRNPSASASEAATYSSMCGVYIWDRQSTVVGTTDYIAIPGIKSIHKIYVAPNGNIRIMCTGANRTFQIREFDGSRFNIIAEAGLTAYPVYPKSVVTTHYATFWLGADGFLYAHGSVSIGEPEMLVQLNGLVNGISNLTTGVISYGSNSSTYTGGAPTGMRSDNEVFFLAYASNNTCAVTKLMPYGTADSSGWTQTVAAGNIYTPVRFFPKLSTVKVLDIFMLPVVNASGSTARATISIYFNQSSTAWGTKNITDDDLAKGYIRIPIHKPFVNSVQIKVSYSTSTSLGPTSFFPSYGVFEYAVTDTSA